ncbi:MAG: hypothetical protein IKY61_03435 [Thermoguttaceae bacterium]|nr:hypothetical protein [Thermoguttaceae bacterium]
MTIKTFDWGDFWASAWSASWCEIGALVALAFLWRRLRTGETGGDAKTDVRALFLLATAFALTTLRKLFNDLDVVALGWAALTLGAAFDYWKARSRRRRERRQAELARRKAEAARRRAFWGGSDSSDASSRRRRYSRRSGRGESERSSSGRSRRSGSSRSRRDGESGSQSDERSGE